LKPRTNQFVSAAMSWWSLLEEALMPLPPRVRTPMFPNCAPQGGLRR
jgi:hypothetical protein